MTRTPPSADAFLTQSLPSEVGHVWQFIHISQAEAVRQQQPSVTPGLGPKDKIMLATSSLSLLAPIFARSNIGKCLGKTLVPAWASLYWSSWALLAVHLRLFRVDLHLLFNLPQRFSWIGDVPNKYHLRMAARKTANKREMGKRKTPRAFHLLNNSNGSDLLTSNVSPAPA